MQYMQSWGVDPDMDEMEMACYAWTATGIWTDHLHSLFHALGLRLFSHAAYAAFSTLPAAATLVSCTIDQLAFYTTNHRTLLHFLALSFTQLWCSRPLKVCPLKYNNFCGYLTNNNKWLVAYQTYIKSHSHIWLPVIPATHLKFPAGCELVTQPSGDLSGWGGHM